LSEILVMGKVFVVMLCYRPIQRLTDDRSINLNLSDLVRFSLGKNDACCLHK